MVLLLLAALSGCAPTLDQPPPVQIVAVTRGGVPAVALFHEPDVRISALAVPSLELGSFPVLLLDQGARTPDAAYFAEAPWAPRGKLRGQGKLRVSFCRTGEAFCTVDSFPVRLP